MQNEGKFKVNTIKMLPFTKTPKVVYDSFDSSNEEHKTPLTKIKKTLPGLLK
jgi:hypothetical protein